MHEPYVQAVVAELQSGEDPQAVVRGLQAALRGHHHEKLLPTILRGVLRILTATPSQDQPRILVARDADAAADAVKQTLAELNATGEPLVTVDHSLIGGHVVRYRDRQYDASYKTQLTKLYRQVTQT